MGQAPCLKKRLRICFVLLLTDLRLALASGSVFIEPNRLVIHARNHQIDDWPKELNGLHIAVISDIHTGGPFIDEKKLNDIVAKTNALHPDLIVLLAITCQETVGMAIGLNRKLPRSRSEPSRPSRFSQS